MSKVSKPGSYKFETNPVNLASSIDKGIKNYLKTTMAINTHYPHLKDRFETIIDQKIMVKGPYVEALPDFEKGAPLRQMITKNNGCLHDHFANMPTELLDRQLHRHQEEAIKLASIGNSLIVATGTGSGKTETFLFPIIDKLLKEEDLSVPGVRALIIYPMNALANDQLYYRIAPLVGKYLRGTDIKFGRYTSDIKAGKSRTEVINELEQNQKLMDALDGNIPEDNWMLTREEMLQSPPHILITNYAMLEHILLLPKNSGLFAISKLNTIVLDEIHSYSGAQATEVAYLLRKLKNRLGIKERIQVFGTSASLSEGENSDNNLIKFAQDLFGEKVDKVIRGKRIPNEKLHRGETENFQLENELWADIGEFLETYQESDEDLIDNWNTLLSPGNHHILLQGDDFRYALHKAFCNNQELSLVSKILSENPIMEFSKLSEKIFGGNEWNEIKALSAVMHVGMLARENTNSYPLMPCRYHIISNSINGLCVLLDDKVRSLDHNEGWSDLKDFRTYQDPESDKPYFRLYTCRRCGQPYVEAFYDSATGMILNKSKTERSDTLQRVIFLLGIIENYIIGDGEEIIKEEAREEWFIDPETWKRMKEDNGRAIKLIKANLSEDDEERTSYVKKCYNCGSVAQGDVAEILIGFHPGDDALSSIVTHKVIEAVPANNKHQRRPLQGRKLLSFSDNRQDAAYFAPFFQRTSNEIALRCAITNTINNIAFPISMRNFIYEVKTYLNKLNAFVYFDENGVIIDGSKQEEVLSNLVSAELCTPVNRKISVESLGIINADYDVKKDLIDAVSKYIPEQDRRHALSIINFCLDTMRLNKAISKVHPNMDMTDEFYWGVYKYSSSFQQYKTDNKVKFGFMPKEGTNFHNTRTSFLVKRLGWSRENALEFLNQLWRELRDSKVLVNADRGFVINSDKIFFKSAKLSRFGYCTTCNAHDYYDIDAKCTVYGCNGEIHYFDKSDRDALFQDHHYYTLYNEKHFFLRAEEHTAALSNIRRQKIEEEFSDELINLLSCTTTMEMGVDLGDLEAVVCLNIPPGISNYQQRTGRAGRRAQAAPFCVTIAKNSLYDQDVYNNFSNYLNQNVSDMFIHLANPVLFKRHQYSVLLKYYLQENITDHSKNAPTLKDLFGSVFDKTDYKNHLNSWFESEVGKLALREALKLAESIGVPVDLKTSKEKLIEDFVTIFNAFYKEVSGKIGSYLEWMKKAKDDDAFDQAAKWNSRISDFLNQFVIGQLTKYGLIPTYSFPINTVTLDIISEKKNFSYDKSDVSLARDASLAISEYSPGSDVVAAGRIWTSRGIFISKNEHTHEMYYRVCDNCQNIDISENKDDLNIICSSCGEKHKPFWRKCIEPKTFVTSYEEKSGKNTSAHRKRKIYSDEAKLISLAPDDLFHNTAHNKIKKAMLSGRGGSEHGRLFVVNSGPYGCGYHRCNFCNYMTPAKHSKEISGKEAQHKHIFTGKNCAADRLNLPVNLAHIFETDVMIMKISKLPTSNPNQLIRTLTEATKFAVTKLLKLSRSEIRATYRIKAQTVEIIIYDSVAGGAGYAVKLFEKPVKEILEYIIRQLNCIDDCENGCRSCLCDYTNQPYWDLFVRRNALKYAVELYKEIDHSNNFIAKGASYWSGSNLTSLAERLRGTEKVNIYSCTLFDSEEVSDEIKKWLIDLIINTKNTNLFITDYDRNSINTTSLSLVNHFKSFINDGRLNIYKTPSLQNDLLPFIEAGNLNYYIENNTSLISSLESFSKSDVYLKDNETDKVDTLNCLANSSKQLLPCDLYEEMSRRVQGDGEATNYINLFEEIYNKDLAKFYIEDPYCGAGEYNINNFGLFIKQIITMTQSIQLIEITAREQHFNDPNYIDVKNMEKKLIEIIPKDFPGVISVKVNKFNSKMHDRKIECWITDGKNAHNHVIYNITGGIDRLVKRNATEIFVIKSE